jgi:hypothetical protein
MLFKIFDIGGTLLVAPFVVSARPLDLLLCAKHLFVAARTVRHELQGMMRRAQIRLPAKAKACDVCANAACRISTLHRRCLHDVI